MSARPSRPPSSGRACRTICSISRSPRSGSRSPDTKSEAHAVLGRLGAPLLVGGSGLYFRAVVDDLRFPPEDAAVRAALEAEADELGADELYRRLALSDPVAADRIEPGNVRRTIRALEVTAITGAPFSDFAAAWDVYDPSRTRVAGVRLDSATLDARVRARVAAMLDAGWLRRGART